jgi:tRNA(Arg) A34 adenosine deaminase TadA
VSSPARSSRALPEIRIAYPAWVEGRVSFGDRYASDEERMRVAIALARWNVLERTGGPFGAAVFERDSGRLVAVGINLVVPLGNSSLHAEMVAFMMAQARIGSYTLAGEGMPVHELATSCDPCAMCLGATLWSGVRRVICGASREDAVGLAFDEGPVFDSSYAYLAERGVEIERGVLRAEAAEVLALYRRHAGVIYNA